MKNYLIKITPYKNIKKLKNTTEFLIYYKPEYYKKSDAYYGLNCDMYQAVKTKMNIKIYEILLKKYFWREGNSLKINSNFKGDVVVEQNIKNVDFMFFDNDQITSINIKKSYDCLFEFYLTRQLKSVWVGDKNGLNCTLDIGWSFPKFKLGKNCSLTFLLVNSTEFVFPQQDKKEIVKNVKDLLTNNIFKRLSINSILLYYFDRDIIKMEASEEISFFDVENGRLKDKKLVCPDTLYFKAERVNCYFINYNFNNNFIYNINSKYVHLSPQDAPTFIRELKNVEIIDIVFGKKNCSIYIDTIDIGENQEFTINTTRNCNIYIEHIKSSHKTIIINTNGSMNIFSKYSKLNINENQVKLHLQK